MAKIDAEKCVVCLQCIPYCPMNAIMHGENRVYIDQEACVECAICIRSRACKVDAIFMPELSWPRSIRAMFSGGGVGYGPKGRDTIDYSYITGKVGLPRRSPEQVRSQGRASGGTVEMKSNDVTGRFREGEIGVACELGRPAVGFYFRDLEKVSSPLAKHRVQFESHNPVSVLIDPHTGAIKQEYEEVKDEKALRGIIETRVKNEEAAIHVLQDLKVVAGEIETVFSVDVISRCKNGEVPIKKQLERAGMNVLINGKTCIGLGRKIL